MKDRSALSPMQQGMLLKSIDGSSRQMYVIQTVFDWSERIEAALFQAAWQRVAEHHEALRTSFHWRGLASPRQEVLAASSVELKLRDYPERDYQVRHVEEFLDEDLACGFLLSNAPPWRVSLLRFKDERSVAVWTFHHLLLDGRSHVQVLREVLAVYDALLAGESAPALAAELPQRLHVAWLAQQDFTGGKEFWARYLSAERLPVTLPARQEDSTSTSRHIKYTTAINAEQTGQIEAAARSLSVSTGNLVQGAWGLVLGWLANESDVSFGGVRACRKSALPDGEHICGLVVNTLPLRMQWNAQSSLEEVMQKLAADWHSFREREHTPLQQIAKWIGLPSSRELFSTAVSFSSQHFAYAVQGDHPRRASRHLWLRQTTPYVALEASFDGQSMTLSVDVPPGLVDASVGSHLAGWVRNTLLAIAADPRAEVASIDPLEPAERHQIVVGFNPHWEAPPRTIDWLDRVSAHARRKGAASALSSDEEEVSWEQMEQRSNQLAHFLSARGVQRNDVVAIYLPRSPEYIWTCLAVLKAGAAYLPIDTRWPAERIVSVLADAQPRAVLSNRKLEDDLPPDAAECWLGSEAIDGHASQPVRGVEIVADQLAYIIYTSGSTGKPKGVEVLHGGLQNLIDACIEMFELSPADRCSFVSNTAFDASVLETWPGLTAGASFFGPAHELLTAPKALVEKLSEQRVTFAFLPTALAEAVVQLTPQAAHAPSRILCGGDQLRVLPNGGQSLRFFNGYGPTECTSMTTCHLVDLEKDAGRNIPIGKPLKGVRAYVLNGSQQLLPLGVAGELVLAGAQLGRGYRHRPELTAAKFIPNSIPEEPEARLYRTGDLVRWLPDQTLQFLGRMDNQVKLRGFRIELGEIEANLLRCARVAEAVVVVDTRTPQVRLVAFVVPKQPIGGTDLVPELTTHLQAFLPEYMVPAFFVVREVFPMHTSGKYDRKALLASWQPEHAASPPQDAEPQNETEQKIIAIWKKTLGIETIRRTDHFFSLGADSLSIINLLCAVELELGKTLSVADVTSDPTPADLARILDSERSEAASIVLPLKSSGTKLPFYCIPGAGGGIHWFRPLADAFDRDRPVVGLELLALSEETQSHFTVEKAAAELMELLQGPDVASPLLLGGYSGGGLIALELAQRLRAVGKTPVLVLIETHAPERFNSFFAKLYRWFCGLMQQPARTRWKLLVERAGWYARFKMNPSRNEPALPAELKGVKERHMEAFFQYQPKVYDGPVALVTASDRPLSSKVDPELEWRHLLHGNVTVIEAPGDHYRMMAEPGVSRMAAQLQGLLDNYNQPHPALQGTAAR